MKDFCTQAKEHVIVLSRINLWLCKILFCEYKLYCISVSSYDAWRHKGFTLCRQVPTYCEVNFNNIVGILVSTGHIYVIFAENFGHLPIQKAIKSCSVYHRQ